MNDRNETARLREAFATTSPSDVPSAECPPATRIWDAADNQVGPKELRLLLQHVAVCPTCTESWRLARELERDDHIEEQDEDAHIARPWTDWQGLRYASAAAALVAVVSVGVLVRDGIGPEPISRSGGSLVLELLPVEQTLPLSSCLLRWTEFEGASYNVRIASQDLNILSEADWLEQPEYLVPEAHLVKAPAGEPLSVYVEVQRLGEGTIASQTFSFQCR